MSRRYVHIRSSFRVSEIECDFCMSPGFRIRSYNHTWASIDLWYLCRYHFRTFYLPTGDICGECGRDWWCRAERPFDAVLRDISHNYQDSPPAADILP